MGSEWWCGLEWAELMLMSCVAMRNGDRKKEGDLSKMGRKAYWIHPYQKVEAPQPLLHDVHDEVHGA